MFGEIPNGLNDQLVRYIRAIASHDPIMPLSADQGMTELVNMETIVISDKSITLVMDFADGTTGRLDIERYRRSDSGD